MLEWDILNYLKKWRTNLRATPHSIREYTNENWDHIIVLSGTADDIRNLFRKEVKHWYHLPFEDLFSTAAPSEAELWDRLIRLKEDIQRKMYELYRDDLREQLLPRCSYGANDFCRCE